MTDIRAAFSIPDSWAVGTKAILHCGDYLCLGIKYPDGLWRNKNGEVLRVEGVEGVLKLTEREFRAMFGD